eukprot:1686162-Alexandrium_andersonii.AAC.1
MVVPERARHRGHRSDLIKALGAVQLVQIGEPRDQAVLDPACTASAGPFLVAEPLVAHPQRILHGGA